MTNQYDGICRISAAHVKFVFVTLPDHIEEILSDNRFFEKSDEYLMLGPWVQEGLLTVGNRQKWQKRRKILAPAFHFRVISEDFVRVFEKHSDIFVNRLGRLYASKGACNISRHVCLFTLDVLCETSMGVEVNAQADEESVYVKAVLE